MTTLNPVKFGFAAAIVSAVIMLVLGIFGNLGFYTGAFEMMQQWHMFFSLSIAGIIGGMIEAAIISYVVFSAFAWLYNKLT